MDARTIRHEALRMAQQALAADPWVSADKLITYASALEHYIERGKAPPSNEDAQAALNARTGLASRLK